MKLVSIIARGGSWRRVPRGATKCFFRNPWYADVTTPKSYQSLYGPTGAAYRKSDRYEIDRYFGVDVSQTCQNLAPTLRFHGNWKKHLFFAYISRSDPLRPLGYLRFWISLTIAFQRAYAIENRVGQFWVICVWSWMPWQQWVFSVIGRFLTWID